MLLMTSKLILIGGAAVTGKTTVANILKEKYNVEMKTFENYVYKVARDTKQHAISDLPKLINPALELLLEDAEKLHISSLNLRFETTDNLNYEQSLGMSRMKDSLALYKRTLTTQNINAFKDKNIEVYAFYLRNDGYICLDDFTPNKNILGFPHVSHIGCMQETHKEYLLMLETIEDIKKYVPVHFEDLNFKPIKDNVYIIAKNF